MIELILKLLLGFGFGFCINAYDSPVDHHA
uniref:Uncharacterized protein n=1 Tax=Ralstonia solanacearum TaxID=305 RepID=A0A0S4VDG1_RALSL|nr:protein of unknown function [Ralstonia solanacearum]